MWELNHKESWVMKNWCFWTVVLEKTLENPLDCKEIKPVNPKGNQSWIFIGRMDAEAETPILWPPNVKDWLSGKDPDVGKDWRQEEKGTTQNEMVGWHHQLNGHEFAQAPRAGDGQGGLACCSPWGRKESDTTEGLNWTECGASPAASRVWESGRPRARAMGKVSCTSGLCETPTAWEPSGRRDQVFNSLEVALQASEMLGLHKTGKSHIIHRKLFLPEPKFVKIASNSLPFITKRVLWYTETLQKRKVSTRMTAHWVREIQAVLMEKQMTKGLHRHRLGSRGLCPPPSDVGEQMQW